ncbi:MAG: hypothetical protein MUF21_12810, partial [Gemmatimonadaceae bacterium]|nr:hypothetical protein [Gemmatimonadaceae bacterium]
MRVTLVTIAMLGAGAGCLRQYVPAKPGSVLDEPCAADAQPGDDWVSWAIPGVSIRTPSQWRLERREPTEIALRRVDAELGLWSGPRWVFPNAEPWQSTRCTVTRGDTVITVQTTRIAGRIAYRVDVSVQPLIEGRHVYLQLQTPYVEQLREMRAIVGSLRFASDTA